MTTHIALLRAINLAGRNRVGMADLRSLLTGLGLENPRSLLQSGNLIFDSRGRTPARLESMLAKGAKDRLGLETEFFVRTASEWAKLVAGNPFPREATRDPARVVTMLLNRAPDREHVKDLEKAIVGREMLRAKDRQLYIVYPDGMGRSRLTTGLIERRLDVRGTARNWNTVLKVAALVA